MRAILIATGYHKALEPLVSYRPSPLLNIADKPIIFHIIELLVQKGVKHFDLILHHLPEQIEEILGDGKRWGIEITHHLIKNENQTYALIKTLSKQWKEKSIILGLGDALPKLPELKGITSNSFVNQKEQWTGWGVFTKDSLMNFNSDLSPIQTNKNKVLPFISAQSLPALKESNILLMKEKASTHLFPTTAVNVEPGIWISRAVVIEPGAEIISPIFIGENSHIKSNATIGPNTVIENHSIIDSGSSIKNSLVCQNSYIGENLEINQCIIDRNALINLDLNTTIHIKDAFILSETTPPSFYQYLKNFLERAFALLLFFPLSPIYLLMSLLYPQKKKNYVKLPGDNETISLKTFENTTYFSHLPLLISIIKGDLHFVGVAPRSKKEVDALFPDWRSLYLSSKIGWITLTEVQHGKTPSVDELYATETYYSAQMSSWNDLKILVQWVYTRLSIF